MAKMLMGSSDTEVTERHSRFWRSPTWPSTGAPTSKETLKKLTFMKTGLEAGSITGIIHHSRKVNQRKAELDQQGPAVQQRVHPKKAKMLTGSSNN
jgi:hypothetical protein